MNTKAHRSPSRWSAYYKNQRLRTAQNKARRAKRYARWLIKRAQVRAAKLGMAARLADAA